MSSIQLIADAGATKTQWCVIGLPKKKTVYTKGISPYFLGVNDIVTLIDQELKPSLKNVQIDAIHYYGGRVAGVSAIFSAANKVYDFPINALFTTADIPDYHTYSPSSCNLCKEGKPVDAIVNGYGYSRV